MDDSIRVAASNFAISVEDWRDFFNKSTKSSRPLVKGYVLFVEKLAAAGLPPIFEGRHLQKLLGLSGFELSKLSEHPESNYRSFTIPKRSGGERLITAPNPLLLHCQYWINEYILSRAVVHDAAHGYVAGRSNLSNASKHIGNRKVLKVDIKDFFASIGFPKIVEVYLDFGYPPNVAFLLARLCSENGALPQGAATSPKISNIVMRDMDDQISAYANRGALTYSRYVDDITLSGEHVSIQDAINIDSILQTAGLNVNPKKTTIQSGIKKIVTGVSIGTGEPKLPRNMRRRFHNNAFFALKRGSSINRDRDPVAIERIIGQITYWNFIEPRNEKVHEILNKLRAMRSVT